ncbi:MAG: hypothetical protein HYU64_14415 [Armatimonadetes bacterium]|nr:hypothetical protein [Armatimonadota bacterium]
MSSIRTEGFQPVLLPSRADSTRVTPQPAESVPEAPKKPSPKPPAQWNILMYLAGDNSLEQALVQNVIDLEKVGSTKAMNVIAQLDRGPHPSQKSGAWANAKRFYVTKDDDDQNINSPVIKEMGNLNMSDPKVLTNFIVESAKDYPSIRTMLVIGDHGDGFKGAAADDSTGGWMTTPQIKEAIAEAEKITGKKIDIVGFDACLMASSEVAYELKDNAKIMIASEESEGAYGWSYNEIFGERVFRAIRKLVTHKLDATPGDLAQMVVSTGEQNQKDIPTLSAVDLSKMGQVGEALSGLGEAILALEDKAPVKSAFQKSNGFGGWMGGDYLDLYDVADALSKSEAVKSDAVKQAAEKVKESLKQAVFAEEHSTKYPQAHGLTAYAPTYLSSYSDDFKQYQDLAIAKDTKWDETLKAVAEAKGAPGEHGSSPGSGSSPLYPHDDFQSPFGPFGMFPWRDGLPLPY